MGSHFCNFQFSFFVLDHSSVVLALNVLALALFYYLTHSATFLGDIDNLVTVSPKLGGGIVTSFG